MKRKANSSSPEQRAIRNFAAVARMLALARRRNLCAWTRVFRAGAAYNALTELNHAGAITLGPQSKSGGTPAVRVEP